MTRTVPALLAGVAVGIAGMRQGARLRAEAARLQRWGEMLTYLHLLLGEGAYTLPEVFRQTAARHTAPDAILRTLADRLEQVPLTALSDHFQQLDVPSPERDVLQRLMLRLEHGSQGARCLACQQAGEEMNLLAAKAQERAKQDAKMWSSLGWTVGICVALMLL